MSAFSVKIKGIAGNMKRTPLDECGYAYKNLDHVLGVLKEQDIAEVAHRMCAVANIKGTN